VALDSYLPHDSLNKRKIKKSTPTLILNYIERYGEVSAKDIENGLTKGRSKAIITAYNTANAVRKAKGKEVYPSLRSYLKARITAVIRYYTNKGIIENLFNGRFPIIRKNNGKVDVFSLGKIEV